MMDADQSKTKSVEKMELVEVGKMDSQKTNVADNSQDKNKAHQYEWGKISLYNFFSRFTF